MPHTSAPDSPPRWDLVAAERRALADLAEGFTAEQWAAQSLCGRWTVRDVVAHVMVGPAGSLVGFAGAMLKARGSFHRANDLLARGRARRSDAELVADLREHAGSRFRPPGFDWHAPLADHLVHHADVAVPLGLPLDRPAEAWAETLPFLVTAKAEGAFVPKGRPEVTLRAIDVDWTHGSGPEVSGPAAALGVTLCGRREVLDRLSGPGVERLRAWLA